MVPKGKTVLYISGSQPGVRVPPGVREKPRGVRQIFISLRLLMKKTEVVSKKIQRGFPKLVFFFLLRGARTKKGWEQLLYIIGAFLNLLDASRHRDLNIFEKSKFTNFNLHD